MKVVLVPRRMSPRDPKRIGLCGVNQGPLNVKNQTHDLTCEFKYLGVTAVRTHDFYGPFDMPRLFPHFSATEAPTPETARDCEKFEFEDSGTDEAYECILDAECKPYLRLGYSYSQTSGIPDFSAPGLRTVWAEAANTIVGHFVDGRCGLEQDLRGALRCVEIWNEPNNGAFWGDNSAESFFELFVEVATRLRESFPDLEIGGPGFTSGAVETGWSEKFINHIANHRKKNPSFRLDFISWHVYGNDVDEYREQIDSYKDLLFARGLEDTELHVTEWNLEEYQCKHNVGSGKGPAWLTACWIVMYKRGVRRAFFYRGANTGAAADEGGYGLLNSRGERRSIAHAFEMWSRFSKAAKEGGTVYGIKAYKTTSSKAPDYYENKERLTDTDKLFGLGTVGKDGAFYLLVTNVSSSTKARCWIVHPDDTSRIPSNIRYRMIQSNGSVEEKKAGDFVQINPKRTALIRAAL